MSNDQQRIVLVETRTHGDDGSPQRLIRYQLGNHLGSASLELDSEAQVISYEEYYPYGSSSYQAVRSQTETPKRYRYTGMERDEETGLNYHTARYYASWLTRWISTDPEQSKMINWSSYCFSFGNPVRFLDRSGKDPTIDETLTTARNLEAEMRVTSTSIEGRTQNLSEALLTDANPDTPRINRTWRNLRSQVGCIPCTTMGDANEMANKPCRVHSMHHQPEKVG